MGTVLILGHSGDTCCRKVQERLLGRARRVIYLQEDRLFPELGFAWEVQGRTRRGVVRFDEQEVEFGEIDAVLARFFGVPVSPAAYESTDGRYVSSEWNALAMAWTSELSCTVINRVRPELWYRATMNVPALASLAPGAPFKRPRMMVTTRLDDARAFLKSCGGRVSYEPLTQPSAYVIEGENGLEKLGGLAGTLPFHLAEVVEGDRFNAFVVGDFLTSGITPADASSPGRSMAARCRATSKHLRAGSRSATSAAFTPATWTSATTAGEAA